MDLWDAFVSKTLWADFDAPDHDGGAAIIAFPRLRPTACAESANEEAVVIEFSKARAQNP